MFRRGGLRVCLTSQREVIEVSASQVSVREAILKAADWIQEHPDSYNFMATEIPHCGSKGCLIGWVGHFLERPAGENSWSDGCEKIMGINLEQFNKRLIEICKENGYEENCVWAYQTQPKQAARILIFYANQYHPAKPLKELPSGSEIVRAFLKENENASA